MRKNKAVIRSSFTVKLRIGIILLTLIPVIIVSAFSYFFISKLTVDTITKQMKNDLGNSIHNFDNLIQGYTSSLLALSQDESFHKLLENSENYEEAKSDIFEKLYLIMGDSRSELSMFVMTKDGDFEVSTSEPPSIYNPQKFENWGVLRKVQENGNNPVVLPNIYRNSNGDKMVLSVALGIYKDEELIAYVIMDVSNSILQETLIASDNSSNYYRHLVASENGVLLMNNAIIGPSHNFVSPEIWELIESADGESYTQSDFNFGKFYVVSEKSQISDLIFLSFQNLNFAEQTNQNLYRVIVLVVLSAALVSIIVSYLFSYSMTKPIKKIVSSIEKIEKGNKDLKINLNRSDEFGYVADCFDKTLESLNNYHQTNLERQDRLRLAELHSLQAQINPHFLYNTLDTIKWMAKLNGVLEIATIVTELGRLLKNSMSTDTADSTLEESFKLISSYIGIQQVRYPDRFDYEMTLEDELRDYRIPKLLLQPLVENAIVHGMEKCMHKVLIQAKAYREDEHIYLVVQDDGIGMEKDWKLLEGEEIALKNIDRRVKLYFGENYGLEIKSQKGKGTTMILKLPFNKKEKQSFQSIEENL